MLGVLALTAPIVAPAAQAQDADLPGTITEFRAPGFRFPIGIVTGPDGAIWFTDYGNNFVGRMTTAGQLTNAFASPDKHPNYITVGVDGNLWFTEDSAENGGNAVVRMTPRGVATAFPLPTADASAQGIVSGPDGKVWFAEGNAHKIASIDPTAPNPGATIVEYPLSGGAAPFGVTVGPDGLVWFTEQIVNRVAHLDPHAADVQASIVELPLPTGETFPGAITSGPGGRLWILVGEEPDSRIDFVTTGGTFGGFKLPAGSNPTGIAPGPDNALWFTMNQDSPKPAAIGRLTTGGELTKTALGDDVAFAIGITPGPDRTLWFTESIQARTPTPPNPTQPIVNIGRISDITGLTEPPPTTAPPTTAPPTTAPPTTAPPTTQPPPTHPPGAAVPAQAIVGTPLFTG